MEHEEVYRALARRLDEIPNGFPTTVSGVELRVLAHLFHPEEAALAVHLRLTPEPASTIAQRAGHDGKATHALLKGMAKRGLIRAERGERDLLFGLMPWVVGIYEMQGGRLDTKLAELVEAYFHEGMPDLLRVKPALHRVIPIEQAVRPGVEILPYERASEVVNQAAAWGVVNRLCREQQRLVGRGCDRPLDVCMVMSSTPGFFEGSPAIRSLTRGQAMDTLRRAEEAGLVHSVGNTRDLAESLGKGVWYMCNCCACCCGILRGVAELGIRHSVAWSGFRAVVDETLCTGCEACQERCHFGALSMADGLCRVDHDRCAGCGLCCGECPSEALALERRPAEQIEPLVPDMRTWWEERAKARSIDIGKVL